MNRLNGNGVKYIDGVYKSPQQNTKRGRIQVALPLDEARHVDVQWQKNDLIYRAKTQEKAEQKQQDKFYHMATAAMTGSHGYRKSHLRLQRRTGEKQVTIAEAMKQAEAEQQGGVSKQIKPSFFTRVVAMIKRSVARVRVWFKRTDFSKVIAMQSVVILILAAALGSTLYSYVQYKSKTTKALQTQQAQSDAKWRELQASWECINNKWNQLQQTQAGNASTEGEITC